MFEPLEFELPDSFIVVWPLSFIFSAHSKQTMEEDPYLESDVCEGNQPIYSNTQGVYYNYGNHGDIGINKEDDDVYILPDHWKVIYPSNFPGFRRNLVSMSFLHYFWSKKLQDSFLMGSMVISGFIFVPTSYLWEGILKSEY